jgi:two-component sensor histidine kinase
VNLLLDWGKYFGGAELGLDGAEIGSQTLLDLMEKLPVAIAVTCGPEHRYVFANDLFRSVLKRTTDDPRGKTIFEILGEEIAPKILTIWDDVLISGKAHDLREYPIHPLLGGEDSFWDIKLLPIRASDKKTAGILSLGVDVTSLVKARDEAERQAHESEHLQKRLAIAIEATHLGLWEWEPATNETVWSLRQKEIFGLSAEEEATYEVWAARLHPEDREEVFRAIAHLADPSSGGMLDLEHRIIHPTLGERWLAGRAQMTYALAEGKLRPDRLLGTVQDITDQKRAEQERQILLRETHHRLKNLFTVANSMVKLTSKSSSSSAEMTEKLCGRIAALSKAHDLLAPAIADDREPTPTTYRVLIATILEPHADVAAGTALRLDGPDVPVGPNAATSLTLIIHELATNAAKYGALSTDEGELHLCWTTDDAALEMRWHEVKGPPLTRPPEKQGFGTRLVQASLGQLGGEISYDWDEQGLRITLRLSLQLLSQ